MTEHMKYLFVWPATSSKEALYHACHHRQHYCYYYCYFLQSLHRCALHYAKQLLLLRELKLLLDP